MPVVCVGTDRPIGEQCKNWASNHLPDGWLLTDSMKDCDVFISVMYDQLLDERFITSKKACFNIHPGILPQYRGSGAYSWVIINGEKETGVTLHVLDVSIDHGGIIDVYKFPIEASDTAETLYKQAEIAMMYLFTTWFKRLLEGNFKAVAQDESIAHVYYRKELEKAKDLTRFIRAFTFKGKESVYYVKDGQKIYLS